MFKLNQLRITRQQLAKNKHLLCAPILVALLLNSHFTVAEKTQSSKASASKKASILVIANESTDQASISASTLRSIFAMRNRRWGEEDRVEVFVLPDDHPTHVSFAKRILHTFPYNLRRIWDRRVYSGTGQLPNVVSTEEEMIEKVSSTPNSIGYVTEHYYRESAKIVELNR